MPQFFDTSAEGLRRNMRRVDVHRKEVYFQIDHNLAGFGWWAYDKITDKSYIEFTHRGFTMRWEIPMQVSYMLTSPNYDVQDEGKRKVVNVVSHFYYRVESALRGGYA